MRILHLLSQHPEATGSGITLQNILHQAAGAGHENFLVAGVSGEGEPVAGLSRAECLFVRFATPPLDFPIPGMSDVMPYASSRFQDLTPGQLQVYEQVFARNIVRAVQMFQPDLIHSHHLWLATATARRVVPEIPMVTSCHSTALRQFVLCPGIGARVRPWCQRVDRVLALSGDQAKKITDLYSIDRERIDIVGGGLDLDLFPFGVKAAPPPVHFLYAGKLSLAKGVDWLLETMAGLDGDNWHLHLAGSGTGEEEHRCRDLAAALGSRVTLHGRLSQQELSRLMRRCHVFVLPSFYEGLPLVLLEALASGCRLVCTDLPGSRQLLAGVDRDLVELVVLPEMAQVDRPAEKDMPLLQKRLALALGAMMRRVEDQPSPPAGLCNETVAPFGWPAVFTRMEEAYARAVAG